MLYVGLDYHYRSSAFCVLDDNGNTIVSRNVRGSWEKVIDELTKVKEGRPERMSVCFEANCGYGHLYDQLKKVASRVVVAHPGQVRLIFRSKRKNDRIDAGKLAKLLYLDEVPPVWVPDEDFRAWRQTIEYRHRMVKKRARAKNEIRALLRGMGITSPRGLFNKKGMQWLRGLAISDELSALKLDTLIEELEGHASRIKRVEKILNRKAKQNPAVQVLMTIPGIGLRTGECLAAYICDPDRFSGSPKVGSYFGLVPSLDASAGRVHYGHITKQGPATARKLLVEAAWAGVRNSQKVRAYFERIMKGDPDRKKIAIVATAHYLLRVSLALLKTGAVWEEEPLD
jgi:transposase